MIFSRLKEERERLGLTQPALAEFANAAKRTLVDWEKGVSSPTAVQLSAIATAGVDIAYVLTGLRTPEHILAAQVAMLRHSRGNQELTELAMKAAGNMNERYAKIKPQLDQLILLTGGLEKEDMKVILDIAAHLYKLHTPNPPMSRVTELVNLLFLGDAEFKLVAKMLKNN